MCISKKHIVKGMCDICGEPVYKTDKYKEVCNELLCHIECYKLLFLDEY